MPLFNFHKQFAADVESGKKRQTIRARRKDGIRPQVGQTAFLYTGTRTKACRKLGEYPIKAVRLVFISEFGALGKEGLFDANKSLDEFAHDDGFESWKAMVDWFKKTHGLPFEGDLIKW